MNRSSIFLYYFVYGSILTKLGYNTSRWPEIRQIQYLSSFIYLLLPIYLYNNNNWFYQMKMYLMLQAWNIFSYTPPWLLIAACNVKGWAVTGDTRSPHVPLMSRHAHKCWATRGRDWLNIKGWSDRLLNCEAKWNALREFKLWVSSKHRAWLLWFYKLPFWIDWVTNTHINFCIYNIIT